MSNYLKVSSSSIKKDAERIEELKEEIPLLINELEDAMHQLANCWEGVAWGTFQQNTALHIEMLTDIYEYMSRYVITMQEAGIAYERTEQDICAQIRKVNTLF